MIRRTLVLGLGNPVRCDDSVGLRIAERLAGDRALPAGVVVESAGTCGLGILDLIAGYDRLILVDAIEAGASPGSLLELGLEDLGRRATLHTASSHDADLPTALATGRRLAVRLPDEIRIVAVQVADTVTLSERCTPAVEAAVDGAVRVVLRIVEA